MPSKTLSAGPALAPHSQTQKLSEAHTFTTLPYRHTQTGPARPSAVLGFHARPLSRSFQTLHVARAHTYAPSRSHSPEPAPRMLLCFTHMWFISRSQHSPATSNTCSQRRMCTDAKCLCKARSRRAQHACIGTKANAKLCVTKPVATACICSCCNGSLDTQSRPPDTQTSD